MEDHEGMLMRKIVAIREKMLKGKLNPLWVDFILQQVIEGNHAGDFSLRPLWATLSRPSLSEIQDFLNRPAKGYQNGLNNEARALARTLNWTAGQEKVNLTLVSMGNLFLDSSWELEYEGTVRKQAAKKGLLACPDWVIPALAIHASRSCVGKRENYSRSFNICLESDGTRDTGFGTFFKANWHIYQRNATLYDSAWSGSDIRWLFVKPEHFMERLS